MYILSHSACTYILSHSMYVYIISHSACMYISGLLTRLLVPKPRRDRDCSRHNPRRDVRHTRRDRDETKAFIYSAETRPRRLYIRPKQDRDVYIYGRNETETRRDVCLIASSFTWDYARCMCSNAS